MGRACSRRSVRHGNAPSPYMKYRKRPYNYSAMEQAIINDREDQSALARHLRARSKGRQLDLGGPVQK